MIIPMRCWTCGKPLSHLWEQYEERVQAGEEPGKVMNELGLERHCCRGSMISHVELIDTIAQFKKA